MNEVWDLTPIYKGFDDPIVFTNLFQCPSKSFHSSILHIFIRL